MLGRASIESARPGTSNPSVYVARQAIFDRNRQVVGYELLARVGRGDYQDAPEPGVQAVLDLGLDELTGDLPGFVSISGDFLRRGAYLDLAGEGLVLQLGPDELVDDRLCKAAGDAHEAGFGLALDGYSVDDPRRELVELADFVKIEVNHSSRTKLSRLLDDFRRSPAVPLATRVDTPQEFDILRQIGFTQFQGFFYERPSPDAGAELSGDRLALLRLTAELQRPDLELGDASRIVRSDLGLTYRLLRLVNSAAFGLVTPVDDVHDAVVMLGLSTLRNVAALISFTMQGDKPTELSMIAMVRAKMCELLAARAGTASEHAAFTAGLLSVLDGFVDAPLDTVLDELPITEELRNALLYRNGAIGRVLDATVAYEHVDLETLETCDIEFSDALHAYMGAVRWAEAARQGMLLTR